MQGKNGWEDKNMQRTVLIPLMMQLLPSLMKNNISPTNSTHIGQMWVELVGGRSLVEEDEPDALKSLEKLSLPFVAASPERSGHELDFSIPYVIRPPITSTKVTTTTPQSSSPPPPSSIGSNRALQRQLKVSMRSSSRAALYRNSTISASATSLPVTNGNPPSFEAVFDPDLFGVIQHTNPNESVESSARQVYHPKIFYTSTYSSCIDSGYLNIDSGCRVNKSPVSLLRQPYALEAPSLSMPLLKMAKKNYCVRELSRALCQSQGQRSFT